MGGIAVPETAEATDREALGATESVCPVCMARIEAEKTVRQDGIYLEKECPLHGAFSTLIWEGDAESYRAWDRGNDAVDGIPCARPVQHGCPYDCGLCADHMRQTCCVLLEVTQRCNLRCPVCFASAGEGGDLSLDEVASRYDLLRATGLTYNIQLSGGEPTMHPHLPAIIGMGAERGFSFFQLNTNGLRLAQEEGYAQALAQAGLSCVFLQFDGVTRQPYEVLRGRALLEEKCAAIDNCVKAGLGVVLVPTVAPGVNDGQLGDILRFALERMPGIRGVHFQPVTYMGRNSLAPASWRITIPHMLRQLEEQTGGLVKAGDFKGGGAENPYCSFHATYLKDPDGSLKVQAESGSSCCGTSAQSRDYVARQWKGVPAAAGEGSCCCGGDAGAVGDRVGSTSSLDDFLAKRERESFAVSGMLFQDAHTLDLARLRRCYICEVDGERGLVPFCAYNLTGADGSALYR